MCSWRSCRQGGQQAESGAQCFASSMQAVVKVEEATPRQSIQVSPAVPSVLFQGVKQPKIATPPQRTSNEQRASQERRALKERRASKEQKAPNPSTPAATAPPRRVSTTRST